MPIVKDRVTLSLERRLLKAIDRAPGENRSEKIERLIAEGLAGRAQRAWVRELEQFYGGGVHPEDRAEDLDWHLLAQRTFGREP
jgi:hypothetical protein